MRVKKAPNQVDLKSAYILDAYEALEQSLVEMLIKRLNSKTTAQLSADTVFQWQLEKMQQLRMMNDATIKKLVEQTSGIAKKELKDLITKQGYDFNKESNKDLANLIGSPVKEWNDLDLILNQYFDSQWLDLDNHVNQTLIDTNYTYNPLSKAYQQVLNDAVARTLTGFETPERAFKSAIYAMVEKGIDSSFIDKGGREWSLERYVRTVIKSTTQRVYNDLRTERGINEYGIVTALMSSHSAARDACSQIQGRFVLMVPTKEAPEEYQHLPSVYDYGWKEPAGCNGINCNHRWYSMLPMESTGIPKPPSPEEAQANAKIVAKQRRMEVAIRTSKKQLRAAELLDDQEGIEHFKGLIRQRQGALRQLIDDNDILHRSYGREAVYSNPTKEVIEAHKETMKSR